MRLYLLDPAAGTPVEVTSPPDENRCTANNGDFWPSWSPDGKQIAFGRKYSGVERIAVLDITSNVLKEWDTGQDLASHPRWSPDGRFILFEEGTAEQGKVLVRLDLQSNDNQLIMPGKPGHLADWR